MERRCLQQWLAQHDDCPTCRRPIAADDVMWIHLEVPQDSGEATDLTQRFGTKPAALVCRTFGWR